MIHRLLLFFVFCLLPAVLFGQPANIPTDPRFANAEVRLMGSGMNSTGNDQVDALESDGSVMFISRTPAKGSDADVYYAIRQTEAWSDAKLLQGYINDSTNNFIGGMTASGDVIAVAKMGEIGFCRKIDGIWRQPIMAKIDSFYTDAAFFNFALSPDGRTLVMALERDDSFGETDLYLSRIRADSTWTAPEHLGKEINTPQFETGPTFSPDGQTLYYSSNGKKGFGGYDLFSTRLTDPRTVNLGPKINTDANEKFYVESPDGVQGYFSSDRKGGMGGDDIYEAVLNPHDTGLYVLGIIIDAVTKKPVIARFEFDLQPSSIKVAVDSSQANGRFFIQLPYLAKYEMRVTADNYFPITRMIGLSRYDEKRAIELDLQLQPLKPGTSIEMKGIEFETGSARLTEGSRSALQQVFQVITDHPELPYVSIEGYTDNVGDREYNVKLSEARAASVRQWLMDAGVPAKRLSVIGLGPANPKESNDTPEGRRANRRVEILFYEHDKRDK